MSETTYSVEFSKSNRASCKKCKVKIDKGEIRIKTSAEGKNNMILTTMHHPQCFSLPRKYATGANKMTAEDFVKDILLDESGGEILPAKADEIAAQIEEKAAITTPKKEGAGGSDDAKSPLDIIKEAYENGTQGEKDDKERSSKKAKSTLSAQVDAYEEYHKCKNDELKDILSWNKQIKTGNKTELLYKVIDGHVHGRLALCPICSGTLKWDPSLTKIICNGKFDEDAQFRVPCSNEYAPEEAPRWQPWYSVEPTEQENEEIQRLLDEASGDASAPAEGDVEALQKAASKLEWKLTNKAGLRKAATDLVEVLQNHPKKLDLPDGDDDARKKVGAFIQIHRDKTIDEFIPLVVKEFGFQDDKEAKAAKKGAAIEGVCKCAANASVVAALHELAELYSKEGNRNAAGSYSRAVQALQAVSFEINADNAKGLGVGKNKIAGVGKGTAEKMVEFFTTGTIAKLEEKRAAVGA